MTPTARRIDRLFFLLTALTIALSAACSREALARMVLKKSRPDFAFQADSVPSPPDYALPAYWAAFDSAASCAADVFFIHPTTFYHPLNWNQPLDFHRVNRWTDKGTIRQQASAFRTYCNIFAPRYRQANLYAFIDRQDDGEQALQLAYRDVEQAFMYYLEHVNQGRPFIIAAHSQGSYHANRLLRDSEAFRSARDRFVAGYLIGWPLTEDDVAAYGDVDLCRDSAQTGCVLTWNTQRRGAWYPLATDKRTVAVNPLSWTTDERHYDKQRNSAAVFFRGNEIKRLPHLTGARLHNGKLLVDKRFSDDKRILKAGRINYHRFDYAFFYENIRDNAGERLDAFLQAENRMAADREQ